MAQGGVWRNGDRYCDHIFTGVALRKNDTQLKADLNAAIKAVHANGTYQKIASKYFDFDVYGK